MTNIYAFSLNDATELRLEPKPGESCVNVHVVQTVNGAETLVYSGVHAKDFHEVPQKRKTIANEVADDAPYESEQTKEDFLEWCKDFGEVADKGDHEEIMRGPTVQEILDETESVEVYGGEETSIVVTLNHNGREGVIEFTPSEWTGGAAGKVSSAYYNEFYEKIKLSGDGFELLTDAWDDQKEIVTRESITGWGTVVSRVINGLQQEVRRTVHEDKQTLRNDEYSAWYTDGFAAEPVVFVRGEAVANELEDLGKSSDQIPQLSKEFLRREKTADSSTKRIGERCYPFYADVLEITEADVHTNDDDGDGEVVEP